VAGEVPKLDRATWELWNIMELEKWVVFEHTVFDYLYVHGRYWYIDRCMCIYIYIHMYIYIYIYKYIHIIYIYIKPEKVYKPRKHH